MSNVARIRCLRAWMDKPELVYPRREYMKKCVSCGNREHETSISNNCAKCGKRDVMNVCSAR